MNESTFASVIIPNFNGSELLKICLPSLKKQSFKNFEVIIIDNGSSDESINYIKNHFPCYFIIELTKNLGFATAVNKGIKKAKGEYIILLNNDTEVERDCIKYLVQSAKSHPDAGFVSAKIFNFKRRNIIDNAGDYIDVVGHLHTRGLGENKKKFNKGEYIFSATGGGALFKKELFKKIGLFDENYFFYMEDIDLCFRAQLAGFKGWFEPKAIIYHIRMATSKNYLKNREYYVFFNMMQTIIKNFPFKLILADFNFLKIILINLNTVRYLIFKGQFINAFRAELNIIFNFRRLIKERGRVQSLKIVNDDYIISQVTRK